jgi:hypothetical protein
VATLKVPLAQQLAETAHWSDDPPARIEDEEIDLLAFELWQMGIYADTDAWWEDEPRSLAARASCL